MATPSSRLDVWAFFESGGKGVEKATYRLCSKALVYKPSGMTSNLIKHLTSVHPVQWRQHKETNQAEVKVKPKTKSRGPLDGFVKNLSGPAGCAGQITNSIVEMVALDLRPVSIVNGLGFGRLMHTCEPGYRVPSATHISSLLRKKNTDEVSNPVSGVQFEFDSQSISCFIRRLELS